MMKKIFFSLLVFVAVIAQAAPTEILFIRHGYAQHNDLKRQGRVQEAEAIRDPELMPQGILQAVELGKSLQSESFDMVLVSPLMRTLETADKVFSNRHIPTVADQSLIEICVKDTNLNCFGEPVVVLQEQFPEVNFQELSPSWGYQHSDETSRHLRKRVEKFREDLFERIRHHNWSKIAVVSHGGFLRYLLGVEHEMSNCEVKRAHFDDGGNLIVQ